MEEEIFWTLEDQVKPEHTALLVIDPQNDFCASDGAFITLMGWDASRVQEAVPRLNRLIQWARNSQVLVVWTRSIMDPNRSRPNFKARDIMKDAKARAIQLVKADAKGSDWYSEVTKPLENEPVITKYHYDAFGDTDLDLLLRGRGIKTILFTGFLTNVCVETAARHGYVKGYYNIVVTDCTDTGTQREYEASIYNIGTYFGKAASSDTIMAL